MNIKSIYEHMENGALLVPSNANCKIIFRHSIRGKIESGYGREVCLTDEGVELARSFGRHLDYNVGFVASSTCDRNIATCREILSGKGVERNICEASHELECPQIKDASLCDKAFQDNNYRSDIIVYKMKTEGLPGFNSIETSAKVMLDFVFSQGNKVNNVDLFCTHDFQMAILYSYLFDFANTEESLKENKWPMMLEGMILWGNRNHFWCSWRKDVKEFTNK